MSDLDKLGEILKAMRAKQPQPQQPQSDAPQKGSPLPPVPQHPDHEVFTVNETKLVKALDIHALSAEDMKVRCERCGTKHRQGSLVLARVGFESPQRVCSSCVKRYGMREEGNDLRVGKRKTESGPTPETHVIIISHYNPGTGRFSGSYLVALQKPSRIGSNEIAGSHGYYSDPEMVLEAVDTFVGYGYKLSTDPTTQKYYHTVQKEFQDDN